MADQEREEYNLHRDQIDDYYHQTPVAYRYNSYGYRTKEFEDINSNFMLAMGCSHTEGVALPEKDIWCTRLAEHLDLDLINMGASGQGLEFICYNSERYISCGFPLPCVVVIQHPERARRIKSECVFDDTHGETVADIFISVDDTMNRHNETNHIVKNDFTTIVRSAMWCNLITYIWNSVGVPVYHWTFNTDGENWLSDYFVFEVPADMNLEKYHYELDHARDLSHHGRINHQCVADVLYDQVKQLLKSGNMNVPASARPERNYPEDSVAGIVQQTVDIFNTEETDMSDYENNDETHEGSMGTDRHPPSGTEQDEREAELKRRIEELRKRDPFIYR